jgi:hypothetical protein
MAVFHLTGKNRTDTLKKTAESQRRFLHFGAFPNFEDRYLKKRDSGTLGTKNGDILK